MRQIGKYQLIEQIGIGGFGEVFKGFDPYIKRHVAIKTCSSNSEEIRSRFFQEAEIAGNLHHRNITTVYDFGVEGELPYLIQEYLSGEDLDVKIRRKDYLPFAEKLFYLIQIARGLAEAHVQGVMHRDIKPANVRILDDSTVKIMDFGIAKLAQQQTGLTQTGMTLGTAAYLSPEQIRGDSMDVRTDIFSFGVLAYELLAYQRPFQGEQISAVLYQLLNHDPKPLTDFWPEAPLEITELIDRCLQKSPSRRFQDGGELLKALEHIQRKGRERTGVHGRTPPAAPPEQPTVRLESDSGGTPTRGGLDEFDLTGSAPVIQKPSLERANTPHRGIAAQAKRGPELSKLTPLALGLLLVVIAGIAGWWLGRGGEAEEEPIEPPAQAEVQTEDVDGAADESAPSMTEPQAPEPEHPVAQQGTVTVTAPGWTRGMTVRVGRNGTNWPLVKNRPFRLDPGSYNLYFNVDQTGYKVAKSLRVRVREGQDRTINPPIQAPAALTVRASPGRPQGDVFLAGELLSSSPLRRHLVEPGQWQVEIRPRAEDTEPLSQSLKLEPGRESILTFDFRAGRLRMSTKALAGPS